MGGDAQATLLPDSQNGFPQREPCREFLPDEQGHQVSICRGDLAAGDHFDPVLGSQLFGLERSPDLIVVGDRQHIQMHDMGSLLEDRFHRAGPVPTVKGVSM